MPAFIGGAAAVGVLFHWIGLTDFGVVCAFRIKEVDHTLHAVCGLPQLRKINFGRPHTTLSMWPTKNIDHICYHYPKF